MSQEVNKYIRMLQLILILVFLLNGNYTFEVNFMTASIISLVEN
jgi:hypothetical protein